MASDGLTVVRSANLSDVDFTFSQNHDSYTNQTTYKAIIFGGCTLNITFIFVVQPTVLSYAGEDIPMSSMSLKFLVEIESWPFQTISNYLEIIVSAGGENANTTNSNDNDGCNPTAGFNSDGHLTWYKVYQGGYVLYTPLVSVAVLDEKIKLVTFEVGNENLVINVPFFWSTAIVDPSYSILLESNGNGDCGKKASDTEWIVGVSVAGAVTLCGIIAATAFIIIRKRKKARQSKRIQKAQERMSNPALNS